MPTPNVLPPFQRLQAPNSSVDDFAEFDFRGRSYRIFRPLKRGERLPTYYIKCEIAGQQLFQSTGEVTKTRAIEIAKLKLGAALDSRWDALRETRLRQPRPVATIGELLHAYETRALQSIENLRMRSETPRRNANALRVLLRRALARDEIDSISAKCLEQSSLIPDFIRLHVATAGDDRARRDSRIRGGVSTVIQARSVFSRAALAECYGSLVLPDLTAFLKAPLPAKKNPPKEGLADSDVWEIAQAATWLREPDPQLYVVHLLFRHLALRNDEIEAARVEWFVPRSGLVTLRNGETRPIAGVVQVITRPYWEPKASAGEVPISPCVWAELAPFLAGRAPLDHIVPASTPTDRAEAVDRRHGDFVRPWCANFRKKSYELRRWGQTLVKAREGDDMARRFVRHTDSSTGGRFYDTSAILPAPISLADCGI